MSGYMKKLCEVMRKNSVVAFSIEDEKCLTQDYGGYVIGYIGKEGEDYSHIIKECEELFNSKSLEPGDDNFTLFIIRREVNLPDKGVYKLGVDY